MGLQGMQGEGAGHFFSWDQPFNLKDAIKPHAQKQSNPVVQNGILFKEGSRSEDLATGWEVG